LPINLPSQRTHGLVNARGSPGAKITASGSKNGEVLAWKRDGATPEDSEEEGDGLSLLSTTPKPFRSLWTIHLSHYPIGLAWNRLCIRLCGLTPVSLKFLRLLPSSDCSLRNPPFLRNPLQEGNIRLLLTGSHGLSHTEVAGDSARQMPGGKRASGSNLG
jgi:hypothetical protein